MKVAFYTLGCKVNQYDTQAMRELFEAAGFTCVDFDDFADVYVINTCSVTQTSDKKSRQMISRAHAKNPGALIVAAGCYAQRAPEEVGALPGVALTMGVSDRAKVVELLRRTLSGEQGVNAVSDIREEREYEELSITTEGRTRAHLKIQEGCDRFCAYCIIPYVRGPVRSRKLENIRSEMQRLADAGFAEIVLTGIHLMSYGRDLEGGIDLTHVLALAEDIPGISRIRLGSLEPQLLSDGFIAALANNPKVCRHFHLSLQSGSAEVLRRMRRRYTPGEYLTRVEKLRAAIPECAITTDIIVGFPGESDEEYQETLDFVKKVGFARIHVFPFSRRKGTAAYDMPNQVPRSVKLARAAKLIALGQELERDFLLSLIGTTQQVLLEERVEDTLRGYTDTYAEARLSGGSEALIGKIVYCRITGVTDMHLDGIILADSSRKGGV